MHNSIFFVKVRSLHTATDSANKISWTETLLVFMTAYPKSNRSMLLLSQNNGNSNANESLISAAFCLQPCQLSHWVYNAPQKQEFMIAIFICIIPNLI
uniref:Uncharacterized protein n=1 Tax=Arundo donax TaxID=35708 RepID=A0A0A9B8N2_ARUDO